MISKNPVRTLFIVFQVGFALAVLSSCAKGNGFAPSLSTAESGAFSVTNPLLLSKVSNTNLEISGTCKTGSIVSCMHTIHSMYVCSAPFCGGA